MSTYGRIYRVIVEPDDPKGWVAVLPAVPGMIAHGETDEAALVLLKQLLQAHLARLVDEGQPIPEDTVEVFWDETDEQAGAKLVTIEV
ncbi:MAG: type II toxin-antitoxin system HicB family antitoxin [Chthonomonadetes bacterium]|nr:type II toxin-antitoxin system HicB family antitoxin [Chthonomonadetes bacterium]